MSSLKEAFQEFDELDDVVYDIDNKDDLERLKKSLDDDEDDLDNIEKIVDIDATDEEDLEQSYVGKLLLYCPFCHTIHYANKEDIVESEDDPEYVNVGEQCPECSQIEGFEVIGEVAPVDGAQPDTEQGDETEEENENDIDLETEFGLPDEDGDEFEESFRNPKKSSFLERLVDNDCKKEDVDFDDNDDEIEIDEKVGAVLPKVRRKVKENLKAKKSLKESKTPKKALKESDEQIYIYQLPKDANVNYIRQNIGLTSANSIKLVGKVNRKGDQPGDILISGTKEDLAKFVDDYFDLQLLDDYLYEEDEFDTDLITPLKVKESKTPKKESKLVEKPVYGLEPRYDARKSFYGKAQVDTGDKGDKNKLYSYDTLVAEIKDGKPVVYGTYSQTTLRHIKDWLKQNGFKAESKAQIEKDYMTEGCKTNESNLNEEVQDEAYEIAEYIYDHIKDKDTITRDDFEEQVALACRELYGIDNVYEIVDEQGKVEINGKTFYIDELLEGDIRGILGYKGWATNFSNGDLTTKEIEECLTEGSELPDYYRQARDEWNRAVSDVRKYNVPVKRASKVDASGKTSYSDEPDFNAVPEKDREKARQSYDSYRRAVNNLGAAQKKYYAESLKEDSERDILRANIKAQNHAKRQPSLKLVKKDDKECKGGECKKKIKESKLNEDAFNEYQKIIDRAKLNIDDGYSDVDEAIWSAIDEEPYLDDFEILKDNFSINDLYFENGEPVSTIIMELIYNSVYDEVSDYYSEKHNDVEVDESLQSQKRTVEQIKESIKTKLDKTIKEGLENSNVEDELDENLFDNLINKYCTRVYENVKDYKTTAGYTQGENLVLEGLLSFKSGKTANTKFIFEKKMVKDNQVKYVGLNESFSKSKKAFTLNCKIDNKKIISESLTYNYKVKVNNEKKAVYGSIKNN